VTKSAFTIGVFAVLGALLLVLVLHHANVPSAPATLQASLPQQQNQQVTPQCPGQKVPYHFASSRPSTPFNPVGACAPSLWHEGHCVIVQEALSHLVFPPVCQGTMPEDAEYVWSGDPGNREFDGAYRLDPPRYDHPYHGPPGTRANN
jgi:hypothetical protein